MLSLTGKWRGAELAKARRRRGLSQAQLGALMIPPVAQSRVSEWERGFVPTRESRERLLAALEVSPSDVEPVSLQQAREASGLSQESVAVALGVGASTVSAWERGTRRVPERYHDSLSQLVDVPVERLVALLPSRRPDHRSGRRRRVCRPR